MVQAVLGDFLGDGQERWLWRETGSGMELREV
jgi:hypothetical protein